jgi:hypothetical protein
LRTAADLALVLAGLPFILAMGLALPVLVAGSAGAPKSPAGRAQGLATAAASGLLVNYALGLVFSSLTAAMLAGACIAGASIIWAQSRNRLGSQLLRIGAVRWLLVLGALAFFAVPILFDPVSAWDARSIWFFHAKRIFYGGGLDMAAGWTNPEYDFSHLDYPKLLPLLAAQFAYLVGFWNEYVPKAGLLMLLAPIVLGLFGAARRVGVGLAFLACAFLFGGKEMIWNGYLDAYVALYCGMSLVYFTRWLSGRAAWDLVTGIVFLGVAMDIKNEGALVAVALCAALAAVLLRERHSLRAIAPPAAAWLAALLALSGFAIWSLLKLRWQIPNDLDLGMNSVPRILSQVGDGGVRTVAAAFASQTSLVVSIAAFLLMAAVGKTAGRFPVAAWFPAVVATLYIAGLFIVYLATTRDLVWHLSTSAPRTVLAAAYGFLAATFVILDALAAPAAAALDRDGRPLGEALQ